MAMKWEVIFHEEFDRELKALDEELQDEILAHAILLRDFGPNLGRPTVDTLKGSSHANMKELRFESIRNGSTRGSSRSPMNVLTGTCPPCVSRAIVGQERRKVMARNLEQVLAKLPSKRREKVERRAAEIATLKGLRQAVNRTQEELASSLGVGQDTISRLEQRSDMLISTLKRYVEAMGGQLDLIARFPNRPPVMIDRIAGLAPGRRPARRKSARRENVHL